MFTTSRPARAGGAARRLAALSVAVVAASTVAAPAPAQAEPNGVSSLRTGMTWSVLGQSGGAVHVGADGQSNVYSGDTTVDQYVSLLCLMVDGRSAPAGIPFDFYNGWAQGAVKASAPVRGADLTSREAADALCAQLYGPGWRQAEFHDGGGGWTFWAEGDIPAGTRMWAAINDQPANPWDSEGDMPAPIGTPADTVVKTRLTELSQPVLSFARDQRFRDVVNAGVARRFDGDDNVPLSTLITDAETAGAVDTGSAAWQTFKSQVAAFANVDGVAYLPQLMIPNYQDGAVAAATPTLTVAETDLSRLALPSYTVDGNGILQPGPMVDEAYAEANEVWVLGTNEQLTPDGDVEAAATASKDATELREAGAARTQSAAGTQDDPACNPTGLRNNRGLEYMQKYKVPNPASVEHWTANRLEPRMIAVGKGGAILVNKPFGKINRKRVKNWVVMNEFITTWDRAVWGDVIGFKWIEEDNGPKITISLGLSLALTKKLSITGNVSAVFESKHDDMGEAAVMFDESTYMEYSTGILRFTECSVGGDGGTGNDNLALAATAAASSTYPGYSPAKVKDGSRDTSVGGASSWVNADRYAPNGYLPQWVQLDFGVNKTFNRVVIYTTAGYPIQDFKVQTWNGITWVDMCSYVGNTAVTITCQPGFSRTSRLVRVYGTKGPANQQQYVRVNEFEVY